MRYFIKTNGKVAAFDNEQLTHAEKTALTSAAQAALDASDLAAALWDAREKLSDEVPQATLDAAEAAYYSSSEYVELQRVQAIKVFIPEDAVEVTEDEIAAHLNPELSREQLDAQARAKRDMLFAELSARFERNASEARLGLETTDSIEALDTCAQALRDITKQEGFPTAIEWPEVPL